MYSFRNPILRAALEELSQVDAAQQEPVEQEPSTADVTATNVVNQDTVAELQDQVEALQDQQYEGDINDISKNSEEVQDDLEEIVSTASALEELADMAFAAYQSGTATKMFNGLLSLGVEQQCHRIQMPCVIAALEAEKPDVSDARDVSKSIGERAKAAAAKIYESILNFFKKIKDWAVQFFKGVMEMFNPLKKQAEELTGQLKDLPAGGQIENEAFIKSLGLTQPNAQKDFEDYAKFVTTAYATLAGGGLMDAIGAFAGAQTASEADGYMTSFLHAMNDKLFTVTGATGSRQVVETLMHSPKLIGGAQITYHFDPANESNSSTINHDKVLGNHRVKISMDKVETVTPAKIAVPDQQGARNMLQLISKWPDDVKRVSDAVDKLEAKVKSSINSNNGTITSDQNEETATRNIIIRNFMATVNQLILVLVPMLSRQNIQVSRKYIAYVKQSLAAASAKESSSRAVATA